VQAEKYSNVNTSTNFAENGKTKKESDLENTIKRVSMPIPNKPKHKKHNSQIFEGNKPINFAEHIEAFNLSNFENVVRSTEQSYQPLNTITTKSGMSATTKRTSVIQEGI